MLVQGAHGDFSNLTTKSTEGGRHLQYIFRDHEKAGMYVSEFKGPARVYSYQARAPGSAVVAISTLSPRGFEPLRRPSMRLEDASSIVSSKHRISDDDDAVLQYTLKGIRCMS